MISPFITLKVTFLIVVSALPGYLKERLSTSMDLFNPVDTISAELQQYFPSG